MFAGTLVAATAWFFVYAGLTDWLPHKVVPIAATFLGVTGIMWLYDEFSR